MTVLWADASHYDVDGLGIGAVVVADLEGRVMAAFTYRAPHATANLAEQAAVTEAFKLAAGLEGPVEVRTDSIVAVKALTAPAGVTLEHGYRGDNTAHKGARRLGKRALGRHLNDDA